MATDLIKVEIIERQTVKPSSPTPHSSTTTQLSVLDQMVLSHVYFPTLLFYSGNNNITGSGGGATSTGMEAMRMKERDYCQHLIRSLAKTLTHFYPLAGRLSKGNDMIQCTDDGAEFVTARVKCSLSQIFEHPDPEMLTGLVPAIGQPDGDDDGVSTRLPLLAVQANLFEYGGIAIGLNFSHKVVDGITASAFISCWAKTALDSVGDDDQVPFMVPKFDAASYFPPLDFLNSSQPSSAELVGIIKQDKCITKRFVFDASKIATLQSNLARALAPHAPTRVLVVSALIWKCAMEASSKSSNIPPSSFLLTMDLRRWFEPPLPQNLAGNVVGILVVTATASLKGQEESNETIDLKDLVAKLSKGIAQQKETYPTKLPFDSNEALQRAREYEKLRGNVDMYHLCSGIWCRFPFYEADFGWGKPTWVSVPSIGCKDAFYLIDKRDGKGIEALLSLSEEIMEHFESNPELLKYASVNPRVM
ncbi:PREDICTED: BAHD acyltransferase At5g47980-like [Prunus mume]|uniref:BAHD acyltransferase At5g47980-like n=1 Tax=Prunus mume TaxID=102107 RepID=A0ABM0NKD6_PRUMU|nr:PREDICTED: BAHD acyltransferase At5g47980-like [Prunus mume]